LLVDSIPEAGDSVFDSEVQLHMILSKEAMGNGNSSKTLKFLGDIQGMPMVILVYSGSSHSFINIKLSSALSGISALSSSVKVQVPNGQILQSSSELTNASWSIQG
jgi:hypothetical protein